jgi:hypothetical protein
MEEQSCGLKGFKALFSFLGCIIWSMSRLRPLRGWPFHTWFHSGLPQTCFLACTRGVHASHSVFADGGCAPPPAWPRPWWECERQVQNPNMLERIWKGKGFNTTHSHFGYEFSTLVKRLSMCQCFPTRAQRARFGSNAHFANTFTKLSKPYYLHHLWYLVSQA